VPRHVYLTAAAMLAGGYLSLQPSAAMRRARGLHALPAQPVPLAPEAPAAWEAALPMGPPAPSPYFEVGAYTPAQAAAAGSEATGAE